MFFLSFNNRKIKSITRFKIQSNAMVLTPKISTVLGQRRINSTEFFDLFKKKVLDLKIIKELDITLKVFLLIQDMDNYTVYIKMPSLSSLINHFFSTNKNFSCPGYFFGEHMKKKISISFNYIVTPYVLYEIIKYKYAYENLDNIDLRSYYKKSVSSLKNKGINVFYSYKKEIISFFTCLVKDIYTFFCDVSVLICGNDELAYILIIFTIKTLLILFFVLYNHLGYKGLEFF